MEGSHALFPTAATSSKCAFHSGIFPCISPCHLTRNVGTSDVCVIMFSTNRYFRLVTKDGMDGRGRQAQAEGNLELY